MQTHVTLEFALGLCGETAVIIAIFYAIVFRFGSCHVKHVKKESRRPALAAQAKRRSARCICISSQRGGGDCSQEEVTNMKVFVLSF